MAIECHFDRGASILRATYAQPLYVHMPRKLQVNSLEHASRQILEQIYQLGEGLAGRGQVREKLSDPPSYSAARTMIRLLEKKGTARVPANGNEIYLPAGAFA